MKFFAFFFSKRLVPLGVFLGSFFFSSSHFLSPSFIRSECGKWMPTRRYASNIFKNCIIPVVRNFRNAQICEIKLWNKYEKLWISISVVFCLRLTKLWALRPLLPLWTLHPLLILWALRPLKKQNLPVWSLITILTMIKKSRYSGGGSEILLIA